MPLLPGIRLGPYEILAPAGAGGMGEVYRARDTRLDRTVAIKILPEDVASDPERLLRFESEARAAAALNHPNILSVFDVGREHDTAYLVTELLEGRTLRDVVQAGGVPLPRALDYAVQLAEGLAAAHARGIVHRDLKPENLFVTTDGRLKILDFGLAKTIDVAASAAAATLMATSPANITAPHVILGTPGYMAPEQVRGEPVDHRADLFAFGCVLYELLGNRRAFSGATTLDTLSAILRDVPAPLAAGRPTSIPPLLARIVERCLEKTAEVRFQSARDLAFALRAFTAAAEEGGSPAPAVGRRGTRARLLWSGVALALVVGMLVGAQLRPVAPTDQPPIVRFALALPGGDVVWPPAVSPDGSRIVFTAAEGGVTRLYVRDLDQPATRPLAGTEGGNQPFFSSDSRSIGFEAAGLLKAIDLGSGRVRTICQIGSGGLRGAAWGPHDRIVFAMWPEGDTLWHVPASGGAPEPLGPRHTAQVTQPAFLDAGHVLYAVRGGETWHVEALSLQTGAVTRVVDDGWKPRAAGPGHLLFVRGDTLMLVPHRNGAVDAAVAPTPMAHVAGSAARGGASYDVSARGTLVTVAPADGRPLARVAWIERDGRTTRTTLPDGRYDFVELSPDRGRIALWADGQIAVGDLARGVVTSITSLGGGHPTWSPDGRFVAYQRGSRLYVADSRAGPDSERPLSEEVFDSPQSLRWTADGSGIAFSAAQPHWDHDLLFLPLTAAADGWPVASASRALVRTKAAELFPRVSPDGRWLAYVAGQVYAAGQIFVQSSASSSDRTQVSPRNGTQPVWSRDGREILFRVDDELWAAPVETKPPLRVGTARRLATVPGLLSYVAADDRRLLVISAIETGRRSIRELHVVVNWQAELAASRGPHR